jgi:hypothetical protein
MTVSFSYGQKPEAGRNSILELMNPTITVSYLDLIKQKQSGRKNQRVQKALRVNSLKRLNYY